MYLDLVFSINRSRPIYFPLYFPPRISLSPNCSASHVLSHVCQVVEPLEEAGLGVLEIGRFLAACASVLRVLPETFRGLSSKSVALSSASSEAGASLSISTSAQSAGADARGTHCDCSSATDFFLAMICFYNTYKKNETRIDSSVGDAQQT